MDTRGLEDATEGRSSRWRVVLLILSALLVLAALDDFRAGIQYVYVCGEAYLPIAGVLSLLVTWGLWRTSVPWRAGLATIGVTLVLFWVAGWAGGSLSAYLAPC